MFSTIQPVLTGTNFLCLQIFIPAFPNVPELWYQLFWTRCSPSGGKIPTICAQTWLFITAGFGYGNSICYMLTIIFFFKQPWYFSCMSQTIDNIIIISSCTTWMSNLNVKHYRNEQRSCSTFLLVLLTFELLLSSSSSLFPNWKAKVITKRTKVIWTIKK